MRRWGVVLGSAAFHALLVLLFILDIGRGPTAPSWRPMTVWMEPPPEAPKKARVRGSRGGSRSREPSINAPPAVASAISDIPAAPATGQGVAPAPSPSLRGLNGCRLATLDRLSPEERARCQERLAQTMDLTRAPKINLDPKGRFYEDKSAYLPRKPKDGCKPLGGVYAADGPGPVGGSMYARMGIGCAVPF
ncbi:hypothetical protein [Caulobacter segnis]